MLADFIKTLPQLMLPKQSLTQVAGLLADVKNPKVKNPLISAFIKQYKVDMSEALEENPANYASFNEFFIRKLKPQCRPISAAQVISPVDGAISEFGRIHKDQLVQAKGRNYSIQQLLGSVDNCSTTRTTATCRGSSAASTDPADKPRDEVGLSVKCQQTLACQDDYLDAFTNGQFMTLYLSPKDYHRVHMPIKGCLRKAIYIPGKLFSVQPATVRIVPYLFARNERLVIFFDTEYGIMAMVMVGATIVGAIGTAWQGEIKRQAKPIEFDYGVQSISLQQAEEAGYFKLGSTVILLLNNQWPQQWNKSLSAGQAVKFGQALID